MAGRGRARRGKAWRGKARIYGGAWRGPAGSGTTGRGKARIYGGDRHGRARHGPARPGKARIINLNGETKMDEKFDLALEIVNKYNRGEMVNKAWFYGKMEPHIPVPAYHADFQTYRNHIIGSVRKRLANDFNYCLLSPGKNGFPILLPKEHEPEAKRRLSGGLSRLFDKVESILINVERKALTDDEKKTATDTLAGVRNFRNSAEKDARQIGAPRHG